jgi:hypothetical protein
MVQLQFYNTSGAAWTQSDFDRIADNGYNAIELIIPWTIETSPGVYGFSLLDTYMGYAQNDGLAVVAVFWYYGWTFGVANWIPSWITSREVYSSGDTAEYPSWWDFTARSDYFALINATVSHLESDGNFQGVYAPFGWLDYPWGTYPSGASGSVVAGYSADTVNYYDIYLESQYVTLANYNAVHSTSYTSWFQIPAPAPGTDGWNDFGNFRIFSVQQAFATLSQYVRAISNRTLFYYYGGDVAGAVLGVNLEDFYFQLASQYDGIVNVDDADWVEFPDLFAGLAAEYHVRFIQEFTPPSSGFEQGFNETTANLLIGKPWDVGADFFTYYPTDGDYAWAFAYFGGLRSVIEATDGSQWLTSPVAALVSYFSGFYGYANNAQSTDILPNEQGILTSLAYTPSPFVPVTDLALMNNAVNLTHFSTVLDLSNAYGDSSQAPYIQGDMTWFANHGGNIITSANSLAYLQGQAAEFQISLSPTPAAQQIDLQGSVETSIGTLFVSASNWNIGTNTGTAESGSFGVDLSTWGLPTSSDYYVTNMLSQASSIVVPSGGLLTVPWSPAAGEVDFYQITTVTDSALASVTVSPSTAKVASGGTQPFTATPKCTAPCSSGTTYSWALTNGAMGGLSASTGASVTFTAGSTAGTVGLFVNATLNGVTKQSSPNIINITVPIPTIVSVTVSPTSAALISGGTQPFTATPKCTAVCPAGTTFAWTLTNGGMGSLSANTGASVTVTAGSTAGAVGLFVNATLNGLTVQSSASIITISLPTLVSVAISPTGTTLASGGTQPFTATPTCTAVCPAGTTYSWALTNSLMGSLSASSGASVTFTAGSTAGTVGLFVNATLNGITVQSSPAIIKITVITLISVALSPSTPTVNAGGTQVFTATPTCSAACPGSITYGWALTSGALGSLSGSGASVTFTAGNTAVTGGIFVNATLSGTTVGTYTVITVTTASITLTSVAVSPAYPTIGSGWAQTFTAAPTCSAVCPSAITYAWALTSSTLGTLSGSGASVTFTAGSNAVTGGIFVNATLNGVTKGAYTVITVTTTPITLTSVTVSPDAPTLFTGSNQAFTATPMCSATCPSSITYAWAVTSSTLGSLSGSGASVTFTAGSTAVTGGIFVNATLKGVTQEASTVITVTVTPITINSVAVSPVAPTIFIGSIQVFTATPTCSVTCPSSITYSWSITRSALGSLSGTGASVTFIAGGTALTGGIFVNATLSGATQKASTVITITTTPTTLSSVALSPAAPTVGSDSSAAFAATPTCSATCPSSITYAWSLTSSALGSLSGSGASVTFTAGSTAVTGGIFVNATLSGTTRGTSTVITVTTAPVVLISVAMSPVAATLGNGGLQGFMATPTCNAICSPGVTYSWTLTRSSMGTLSATNGQTVTFTAGASTGTVGLIVNATLKGVTTQSSAAVITITGSTVVVLEAVTIAPVTATVAFGATQLFNAEPTCLSNGRSTTCPSSEVFYTWTLSNNYGSIGSATGLSTTFTAGSVSGVVDLTVRATLNGVSVQSVATITVTSASAPTGLSLSGDWGYIIIGVVLVVVAVLILLAVHRRRRASDQHVAGGAYEQPGFAPAAGNPFIPEAAMAGSIGGSAFGAASEFPAESGPTGYVDINANQVGESPPSMEGSMPVAVPEPAATQCPQCGQLPDYLPDVNGFYCPACSQFVYPTVASPAPPPDTQTPLVPWPRAETEVPPCPLCAQPSVFLADANGFYCLGCSQFVRD